MQDGSGQVRTSWDNLGWGMTIEDGPGQDRTSKDNLGVGRTGHDNAGRVTRVSVVTAQLQPKTKLV